MSVPPVTRFAPSPTGYLHLGHVLSAMYVWGLGRKLSATILLRIEDHDDTRSKREYEDAILADLRWLGFVADNQNEAEARPSRFRQSDHEQAFAEAIERLGGVTRVYACDCSRKTVQAAMAANGDGGAAELRYTGTCRERGLAPSLDVGLRVEMPDEEVRFEDLILGTLAQNPARQCGDLLLRDRQGNYTYQLGVVVDDFAQGVDLVIRGQDLTASTARQIVLARLLGRARPATFAHHPLLVDVTGRKLGKRFMSEAVAKRRTAGERPEDVLGEAAFLAGLTPTQQPLTVADLPALFPAPTRQEIKP